MSTAPITTAWVLTVEHRHGDDVCLYATEEHALNALHEYVKSYWNEDGPGDALPMPEDRDLAIDGYFAFTSEQDGRSHETYDLVEKLIVGATS